MLFGSNLIEVQYFRWCPKKDAGVIWFYDCKVIKMLQSTIQPNFEVVYTLCFSLFDIFFSTVWIINDILGNIEFKVSTTKMEYFAQNHHCFPYCISYQFLIISKSKIWQKMYSWKLAGIWIKTGSRLEVDWK